MPDAADSQSANSGETQSPAQVSDRIERLVREEVLKQFRKESELLKESVSTAVKILGAAAAVFLAVFTVFGITTWGDIKKEATAVVKLQAEELVKKADSETSIKKTLTDLLNRAVVNSVLASRANRPKRDVILANNDWDRLRTWLKNEDLEIQDFKDTLAVLNAQDGERKNSDANRLISMMLNPPEKSTYQWIYKQPEKIQAILDVFKEKALGSAAAELVTSNALTEDIRASAARYVMDVEYAEGVDKLLDSYTHLKNGDTKKNTLVSCVVLGPDHPGVIAEVRKILSEKPSRANITTAGALLAIAANPKARGEFQLLVKDLFAYAGKNGTYISLSTPRNVFMFNAVARGTNAGSEAELPHVLVWTAESQGVSNGARAFTMWEFEHLAAYWSVLSESANAGNIKLVTALLLRNASDPLYSRPIAEYQALITADPAATVTLIAKGGVAKSVELRSLKGATLHSTGSGESLGVEINWESDGNRVESAKLVALKGSGFKFSLYNTAMKGQPAHVNAGPAAGG
jgi:acyl transferase domain-containing protein